jgi:methylated-DNA-protein-cysteine methyltransferase-like protein
MKIKRNFSEQVFSVVCLVPAGRLTTYGDVAAAMGSPRSARRVGYALSGLSSERIHEVPWHRVINIKGTISIRGSTGRGLQQRQRLENEGIFFDHMGRTNLGQYRWHYPNLVDLMGENF